MDTKHGYSLIDWNNAKEEMRKILIERAKVRGMMSYIELVGKVKTIRLEPHSQALDAMLEEISSEEDAAGHGMLTVIVVHKCGDMEPGSGFFKLAEQLGRNTSNTLECWVSEFKSVHNYWGTS